MQRGLRLRAGLDRGIEPTRLAADLLAELRHLLVARLVPEPAELIDLAPEEVADLVERARSLEPETLQRLFRVLLTRIQDLAFAPQPGHAVELAVVRLATLPDAVAVSELLARLDALDGRGPPGSRGGGTTGGSGQKPARPTGVGADSARRPRSASASPSPRPRAPEPPPPEEPPPSSRPVAPQPLSQEERTRQRNEAKTHPAVRDAIEILDAELRDVRSQADP